MTFKQTFDSMGRSLSTVGRHAGTGGYRRYAWTSTDADLREWFVAETKARGLDLMTDRTGNHWAWWGGPDSLAMPRLATGSQLDSVPDGGAYDGPLGVISALSAQTSDARTVIRGGETVVDDFRSFRGPETCAESDRVTSSLVGSMQAPVVCLPEPRVNTKHIGQYGKASACRHCTRSLHRSSNRGMKSC